MSRSPVHAESSSRRVTVIDASALVDDLVSADAGAPLVTRLPDGVACAPELLVAEVLSAIRRGERRGSVTAHRAAEAVEDLLALDVRLFGHAPLARRAFELRANLTSADALYVALAEAVGEPLLTSDAGLARAVRRHTTIDVLVAGETT
jgi:predicted nucleic acid-binding protein